MFKEYSKDIRIFFIRFRKKYATFIIYLFFLNVWSYLNKIGNEKME